MKLKQAKNKITNFTFNHPRIEFTIHRIHHVSFILDIPQIRLEFMGIDIKNYYTIKGYYGYDADNLVGEYFFALASHIPVPRDDREEIAKKKYGKVKTHPFPLGSIIRSAKK